MAITSAAELAARLDRLPMTRHIWVLVTLISLGGCFELYDLFLTAYIGRGCSKPGISRRNRSARSACSRPMG
jgi:putative MFS transporter